MKVLVIGEICTDKFVYGHCNRLNPEAPTPVFIPEREESNLGMAGNTYMNLQHFGLEVDVMSGGQGLINKTRYVDIDSNYILLRVDTGEQHIEEIGFEEFQKKHDLKDCDAVVISDYDKGLISETTLEHIFIVCKSLNIPTFMDTKKVIGDWAIECDYIKINKREYEDPRHHDDLSSLMFKDKLIVTLGSEGAMYKGTIVPTKKVSVRDVVGAGDTFLAGLVYGYLMNGEIEEGIELANKLASNVVTKKGVALPNKRLLPKNGKE